MVAVFVLPSFFHTPLIRDAERKSRAFPALYHTLHCAKLSVKRIHLWEIFIKTIVDGCNNLLKYVLFLFDK